MGHHPRRRRASRVVDIDNDDEDDNVDDDDDDNDNEDNDDNDDDDSNGDDKNNSADNNDRNDATDGDDHNVVEQVKARAAQLSSTMANATQIGTVVARDATATKATATTTTTTTSSTTTTTTAATAADDDDESTTDVVWAAGKARIIELNVGGTRFATSSSTIARFPSSMLYVLVFGSMPTSRDEKRRYFVDRDGTSFRHVLNYMRSGRSIFRIVVVKLIIFHFSFVQIIVADEL